MELSLHISAFVGNDLVIFGGVAGILYVLKKISN